MCDFDLNIKRNINCNGGHLIESENSVQSLTKAQLVSSKVSFGRFSFDNFEIKSIFDRIKITYPWMCAHMCQLS